MTNELIIANDIDNEIVNLVEVMNNEVVVSSRQVAEHFGKKHKHVLDSVRTEIEYAENSADPIEKSMFIETTYVNEQNGQEYPMYLMNRDGFSLIAMGFNGKKASEWKRKYIKAFNYMEAKLIERMNKPQLPDFTNPAEAAREWAKQYEQRVIAEQQVKQLTDELEEAKPKVLYCDTVFDSKEIVPVSVIAKDYGMTAIAMNELLKEQGIQYKLGSCWYISNKYAANNYIKYATTIKKDKKGEHFTITYMKWTNRGRIFIYNFLKDIGILPLIERS